MKIPTTLEEQLRPVAAKLFPLRPKVMPVTQIVAELDSVAKLDTMAVAQTTVMRWLQTRIGSLPKDAWAGEPFELDEMGTQAAAVRIKTPEVDYWTLRFVHIDEKVARNWTTETTIGRSRGRTIFGVRLVLSTREANPNFEPSIPGVVYRLSEHPGLTWEGRKLSARPWNIETADDVDSLVDLIADPKRRAPVIVVSLDERQTDPSSAALDVEKLAGSCIGIAHVVVLPGPFAFALTDRIGKEFSVYRRAVRIYRPGCSIESDSPFTHPLTLAERIENWQDVGPSEFNRFLIRHAAFESVVRIDADKDLPTFSKVRQLWLEQRIQRAIDTGNLESQLSVLQKQNTSLQQDNETALSLAESEQNLRQSSESRAETLDQENQSLRWRIRLLEQRLEAREGTSVNAAVPSPQSFDQLKQWAEANLAAHVVVTGKAVRAAKASPFLDVQYAYQVLLMMSDEYYKMRTEGGPEHMSAFREALDRLELDDTHAGEESKLMEQGDELLVEWRGRKRLLSRHLKRRGNTREPTRSFRLYYFWDDETQQVVIGSLPGHLTTRHT